jgi:lysozyme family protein
MNNFESSFEAMILREGGYVLHNVKGDRGGMTYAGIARNKNPNWQGWQFIDANLTPPSDLVRTFYRDGWWVPLRCDEFHPLVADTIFDFGVNSSAYGKPTIAIKLAQLVAGTTPDGNMGPKTVEALNKMQPEIFRAAYALAKLKRYAEICNRDRTQSKFLLGWVNRLLGQL